MTRLEGGQRGPARTKRAASRRGGPGRSVCADALPQTRGSDGDPIGRLPFTVDLRYGLRAIALLFALKDNGSPVLALNIWY